MEFDSLLFNSYGCDKFSDFLDLIINYSVFNSISDTACDLYVWDGVSYSSSGQYSNTYTSVNGCDSIVILDLIINSTSSSSIVTACNSYSWNGITYNSRVI